jgi:serine/threonine-protein kinase
MQAQRDGSDLAAGAFRHAVIADPGLAAAHLRLAGLEIVSNPVGARKDFEAATALRATLSEHDQTLLDALEPYIRRDPADLVETLRRLRAASQRYPLDADFALRVAAAEDGLVPFAEIHKQTARALELDPKFGLAYFVDAISYAYEGDFTAVQRVSDTCLREVPGADRCRRQLIDVLTQTGPCASLEALARTQTVASPSLSRDILADALAGEDRPVPLIRETLGPDGDGPAWTYTFEVLAGHFVAAEAAARELVANAGRTRGEHSVATRKLVELLREQGKDRLAGEVAQDYLKRKDAWIADPRGEDYAIARDPTPYMAWVAMKGGSLGPADLDRVRDEWLASWRTHVRPTYAPFLWLHAWAATADSREVADRALAARGAFEPIPRFSPLTLSEADVGRTLLAAGRTEEGITALREAAGSCLALRFPVEHTRAILALAEALEGQGDPKGACDGYARVLARWGEEKTSKSAARARARAKAIACSRR